MCGIFNHSSLFKCFFKTNTVHFPVQMPATIFQCCVAGLQTCGHQRQEEFVWEAVKTSQTSNEEKSTRERLFRHMNLTKHKEPCFNLCKYGKVNHLNYFVFVLLELICFLLPGWLSGGKKKYNKTQNNGVSCSVRKIGYPPICLVINLLILMKAAEWSRLSQLSSGSRRSTPSTGCHPIAGQT